MSNEKRVDKNVSAKHYEIGGISVYDIWKAKLSKEELKGLFKGNIIKYICRADYKNGIEDYRKATQYFEWLLEVCEEIEKEKQ